MSKLLSFTDIEGTLQSKAGCIAAMISELSLSGFQIARGFIISSDDVRAMLMSDKVRNALAPYLKGCVEGDVDGPRDYLLNTIQETRLPWDTEMEAIVRFRELDTIVSIKPSTISGQYQPPVFAHSESSFSNALGKLVGEWLLSCPPGEIDNSSPALMVQEVVEAESSIEIKRKKDGWVVRAVFGLSEGLSDPAISSDHYHFDTQLQLVNTEEKEQIWQHVAGKQGIERVDVLEGFREEPKLSQEQLDSLIDIMSYMLEKPSLEEVIISMVDGSPIIMDAKVSCSDMQVPLTLAHRNRSHSLIQVETTADAYITSPDNVYQPLPKVMEDEVMPDTRSTQTMAGRSAPRSPGTRIILKVQGWSQLDSLTPSNIPDIMLLGEWAGPSGMASTLNEAFRRFPDSSLIIQIRSDEEWLKVFMECIAPLVKDGKDISIILPETRTLAEHQVIMKLLSWTIPDDMSMPKIWASLSYPSNLFFISEMSRGVDIISADLESLVVNLGGHGVKAFDTETGHRVRYDDHSVKEAIDHLIDSVKRARKIFAVHSPSFKSNPGLLETLIRQGVDILALSPGELEMISDLVHSLEEKGPRK